MYIIIPVAAILNISNIGINVKQNFEIGVHVRINLINYQMI